MTTKPPTDLTPFEVKNFIDAKQLKKDLAYSPLDLSGAMMDQASNFAYYGMLAAEGSHQTDVVKMLLESTEAAVYKLLRDAAIHNGEKPTVVDLEARVTRQPRVIDLKKALNEAKRVEATGKVAVEAFKHRRDMLIQAGLISREEMKGELAIVGRNAREEVQDRVKATALERIQSRHQENLAS